MNDQGVIKYVCSHEAFRPATVYQARWLDWEQDLERASELWGMDPVPFQEIWDEARDLGYQYAAVVENDLIIARAAIWRFSDTAWDLAAVTLRDPSFCRQGYAKSVCSFVTAGILNAGRIATCHTRPYNTAMRRTAESIGFREVDSIPGQP